LEYTFLMRFHFLMSDIVHFQFIEDFYYFLH
jgi:hypothetical protein